jgi:hypothetical protein
MADQWSPFKSNLPNPEVSSEKKDEGATGPSAAELIAASVTAAINPLIESNKVLASRLEAVEASTKRPVRTEPTTVEQPASVFDDEDKAFAQHLGPLAQRQLEFEARVVKQEVKQEFVAKGYGDFLTKFAERIDTTLDNSPLVAGDGKLCRGDRVYIRNVINMVIGEEATNNKLRFDGKERGFFLESAGGDAGVNSGGVPDDGLTDEQRKIFLRMGVDPKTDGKKAIARLKFVH